MKILGLIPARGGSKGVPRKNIKLLGGKPLISWTIETALASRQLARLIVSTEDREIAEIAKRAGAEVPFLRSSDLSSDSAKSIDVVVDVLNRLAADEEHYDAVCLLQPTTPFRSSVLLDNALNTFKKGGLTGLISVTEVPHHYHPNWAFIADTTGEIIPAQGRGSIITRRQKLPPAYVRDGAVYVTSTEILREKDFFGPRLGYVVNNDDRQVNIDTLADWQLAESQIKNKN